MSRIDQADLSWTTERIRGEVVEFTSTRLMDQAAVFACQALVARRQGEVECRSNIKQEKLKVCYTVFWEKHSFVQSKIIVRQAEPSSADRRRDATSGLGHKQRDFVLPERPQPVDRLPLTDEELALHQGLVQYRPSSTRADLIAAVQKDEFEQVFIDATDWRDYDSLVQAARQARAVIDEAKVNRYQPVIISIALVPDDKRRQIVKTLSSSHLPMVDMTFEQYTAPSPH